MKLLGTGTGGASLGSTEGVWMDECPTYNHSTGPCVRSGHTAETDNGGGPESVEKVDGFAKVRPSLCL